MIRWLKWVLLGKCDHYRSKDIVYKEDAAMVAECRRCGDADILWLNEHAGYYTPIGVSPRDA